MSGFCGKWGSQDMRQHRGWPFWGGRFRAHLPTGDGDCEFVDMEPGEQELWKSVSQPASRSIVTFHLNWPKFSGVLSHRPHPGPLPAAGVSPQSPSAPIPVPPHSSLQWEFLSTFMMGCSWEEHMF